MSVSTIMGVPIANIAKINGIPIANISKWNGEDIYSGVPFTTEWSIPSDSLSLELPLSPGSGYIEDVATFNCTVDWGDSTQSTITSHNDINRTHSYTSAGIYQVKIYGTCEGWSFNNTGDKLKLLKVISFGNGSSFKGFTYLEGAFSGCLNLTTLGSDRIKASGNGLYRLGYFCNNCENLVDIPVDLFQEHNNVIRYTQAFYNCIKLKLSGNIFYQNGEQTTKYLNKTLPFDYCFYRVSFSGMQGTAPDLWNCNFGTGTLIKTSCFGGAGNSSTSLSNYADIPADWK